MTRDELLTEAHNLFDDYENLYPRHGGNCDCDKCRLYDSIQMWFKDHEEYYDEDF